MAVSQLPRQTGEVDEVQFQCRSDPAQFIRLQANFMRVAETTRQLATLI